MTQEEALEVARVECARRGWSWTPEVVVGKGKKFYFFGPLEWFVLTNYPKKGGNARISIDDATGKVVRASFSYR
ncbi:MAG: hypothetical protein AB7K24_03180 [Gemmataceae bacterium]